MALLRVKRANARKEKASLQNKTHVVKIFSGDTLDGSPASGANHVGAIVKQAGAEKVIEDEATESGYIAGTQQYYAPAVYQPPHPQVYAGVSHYGGSAYPH